MPPSAAEPRPSLARPSALKQPEALKVAAPSPTPPAIPEPSGPKSPPPVTPEPLIPGPKVQEPVPPAGEPVEDEPPAEPETTGRPGDASKLVSVMLDEVAKNPERYVGRLVLPSELLWIGGPVRGRTGFL